MAVGRSELACLVARVGWPSAPRSLLPLLQSSCLLAHQLLKCLPLSVRRSRASAPHTTAGAYCSCDERCIVIMSSFIRHNCWTSSSVGSTVVVIDDCGSTIGCGAYDVPAIVGAGNDGQAFVGEGNPSKSDSSSLIHSRRWRLCIGATVRQRLRFESLFRNETKKSKDVLDGDVMNDYLLTIYRINNLT